MIKIGKSPQPRALGEEIAKGARIYPYDLSAKTMVLIRKKLLDDQGFICCYCQRRIPHKSKKGKFITPKSKIEHFKCQKNFPRLQLDYRNMFIACRGKGNNDEHTCDTKKEDDLLLKTDFSKAIQNNIYYTKVGEMKSFDTDLQKDIDEILNLNEENLRVSRSAIYVAIQMTKKRLGKKPNYQTELSKLVRNIQNKNSKGQLVEFLGTHLYFLNK